MYMKEFEIRWSDLDANRHLGNMAYVDYMGHTRLGFFEKIGMPLSNLVKYQLGPVVFYEHIYYFREILPGTPVRVSLEMMGLAEDGRFFEFHHDFYDPAGTHMAHGEMLGAWIDLSTRKLTGLPPELLKLFDTVDRPPGFRVLTKEDTRRFAKHPKNLG